MCISWVIKKKKQFFFKPAGLKVSFLECFLTAPDFSDMEIGIGEIKIPIHKIIFATYPFFF